MFLLIHKNLSSNEILHGTVTSRAALIGGVQRYLQTQRTPTSLHRILGARRSTGPHGGPERTCDLPNVTQQAGIRLKVKVLVTQACQIEDWPSFLSSSVGKNPPGDSGSIPGLERKFSWRRDRLPTAVFLGFPWGSAGKEST